MVKFTYLPDDRIAAITEVFSAFNEPSIPIPEEITELTGITDEMVSGHRIDPDVVASFASDAVLRHSPQCELRPKVCGAILASVREEALGLFSDGSRVAKARIPRVSPRLSIGQRWSLPSGASSHRRL
ncbi:hypothetical protein [Bradyrhizobium sp. Leo121]|uniref:hypothetical protein n=1 Tax=Bradyrhizobium sp. Leo121 TaxID=1571195 RepID=UPI0032E461C3